MAITLVEAAKLSNTPLQKGVIETFVLESSILDRIPFLPIEGNAYAYNAEGTLPGVEFRAVNGKYNESTGTVVQRTETLVILGGDADVDRFIAKTRGNLNDQRAVQTSMKVKAAAYKFQDSFFNGDVAVDPLGFDGLKKRLIGAQVLDAGVNGLPVFNGTPAAAKAFFNKLDLLVAQVPGLTGENGAFYANRTIHALIKAAGREIGGVEMVREDMTGKRVLQWNGIPVLDPGETPAGVAVLPQTETQGTATDATSIYAVKFGQDEGDKAVTGLTNGGVDVYDLGELQEKPAYRTRIEFYTGLATFGGKAAARLRGVVAA